MRKGLTFLLSATLSVMTATPSMAQDNTDPTTVVARVNGQEITLGHIIVTFASLPQQYQQLPVTVLYPNILDQLIQQTALAQAFEEEDPLYVRLSIENERRALLAAEEINRIMETGAGDAEIQAAYDAQYAEGYGGDEFNAAHILLDTEDEAKSVKAMLDTGADFADLAKEKSTGPSGPNGGSLGWFGLGAMVPEFEEAVVALKPGQVSDPVQTQFGWHVLILNEKRKVSAPPLDEVRGEIANRLQNEAVEAHVDKLTAAARVERLEIEGLDMSVMQQLDLVRN
ncbi:MAG: peptidylprolyl isomerase [Rhodobacteraceae bacterium]|nr:peptidylprolyl isomerase [Paracoccaceae bacterium]